MMNAVLTAIFEKLKADATLTGLLGGEDIYAIRAPSTATAPYITFDIATDTPSGEFGALDNMEDITFYVNIFARTPPTAAGEIDKAVRAVLDDCSLTIAGYANCMYCMREYSGNTLYDAVTKIYQRSLRYRLIIEKD